LTICPELRALFLAACLAAPPAALAQVRVAAPVRARLIKPPAKPTALFKGEVVHADAASIVVRSRSNPRVIRTFSYSPRVRAKMEKLLGRGENYRWGDRVGVRYHPGEDVALEIRGKPSKPR
jgi:hypothetical protein